MKVTKKIQAELAKAYQCAMDVSILDMKAPLRYINQYIAEDVNGYGTAADEKVRSRKDFRKMAMDSRRQSKGMMYKAKIITPYRPKFINETTAQFRDEIVVQIGDKKNMHTLSLWFSTIYKYQYNKWQMVLFHGSMPDLGSSSSDTFHIAEAERKVKELEQVVEKRTAELQTKNRELEIETSLEKVRTVAMGMKGREDMLKICKTISLQLKKLGVKEIRNVQTAIFYPDKGTYMNYEYYAKHNKTFITDVSYTNHTMHRRFASQMMKGKGEFFISHIKGRKKLDDWLRYQKTTNVFIDKYIKTASSLNYYWFSLGPVALGTSTYFLLAEEEKELFKRFVNVFELAYRRYLDIEKAEAQAREAEIELGLERVRARAMAMQKSDELSDLVDTVFKELTKLDFALNWCIINIIDEPSLTNMVWAANPETNKPPESYLMKFEDYPFHHSMLKGYQERKTKHVYVIEGEEKKTYDDYLFNKTEWRRVPKAAQDASKAMKRYVATFTFSNFGGLQTVGEEYLSEENLDILSRFGKVFDLTYTRFNDLKQAEAQARESQIQLALERVRARTMAMQRSEELKEVIRMVLEQFIHLNIKAEHAGFYIDYKAHDDMHIWLADPNLEPFYAVFPYFNTPTWNSFLEAKAKGITLHTDLLDFKTKNKFYKSLFKLFVIPEEAKKFYLQCKALAVSTVLLDSVGLYIENFDGIPYTDEENNILMRFGKVFQQSYTRFLDLQKAEEQAREAEIQLALERTRSQSMTMQHSTELDDTLRVFHEQVIQLGIHSAFSFLWLPDEEKDRHIFWAAWKENNLFKSKAINYPLDRNDPATAQCLVDWKGNEPVVSYHVPPAGVEIYFAAWKELLDGVEKLKPEYFRNGLYYVEAFIKYGCFGVMVESELTTDEKKILLRFATEFERTYTRFLDLQKAEAQSREAQIEAALERIRARALAMHQSEEFTEVAKVMREQMGLLGQKELETSAVHLYNEDADNIFSWRAFRLSSKLKGNISYGFFKIPKTSCAIAKEFVQQFKSKATGYTIEVSGARQTEWYKILFKLAPEVAEAMKKSGTTKQKRYYHFSKFSGGALLMVSSKEPTMDAIELQKRAAQVFDLAYKRFKDLQKAEAQAREAKIEAALEKVRSRTMGMQHSDELPEAANLLFLEVQALGIPAWSCGYNILAEDKKSSTCIMSSEGRLQSAFHLPFINSGEPSFAEWLEAIEKGEFFVQELSGKKIEDHYNYMKTLPQVGPVIKELEDAGLSLPTYQINHLSFFNGGFLLFITYEPVPYAYDIFKRFTTVFEQTYTRFLDLQKAEAQAREAQIEAALEKVRSRSLAMHQSVELQQVVNVVFEKIMDLGVQIDSASIIVLSDIKDVMEYWVGVPGEDYSNYFRIPYFDDTQIARDFISAREKGHNFNKCYTGSEKNEQWSYLFKHSDLKQIPDERKKFLLGTAAYTVSVIFTKNTALQLLRYEAQLFSEKENEIFLRFANVFEQAYTRFLDLQKAEEQTRQALIEASLERIRSKAMAMHNSSDLSGTVSAIFTELKGLGIETIRTGVAIYSEDKPAPVYYASGTSSDDSELAATGSPDPSKHSCLANQYNAWATQNNYFPVLTGDELKSYYEAISIVPPSPIKGNNPFQHEEYGYYLAFPAGNFYAWSLKPYTKDEINILTRFKTIVDLTFKRYFDIERAEAQARESEIQLALERVRASTAAMHKSDELIEVINTVFQQLQQLHFTIDAASLSMNYKEDPFNYWMAISGHPYPSRISVPYKDIAFMSRLIADSKKNVPFFAEVFNKEEKDEWVSHILEHTIVKQVPEERKKMMYGAPGLAVSVAIEKNIALTIANYSMKPFEVEENAILKRFANVFEQTYTRFLDLKKAEAQAREAQVENALEKVRSRTLAMQRSDELAETAAVLFQQLIQLGIEPNRLYIGITSDNSSDIEFWITDEDGSKVSTMFKGNAEENASLKKMFDGWIQKEKSIVIDMQGKELEDYFHYLGEELHVPFKAGLSQKRRWQYIAYFSKGFIGMASPEEQPEDSLHLLERFAYAFNLTFTRFNDLKIAEAHAVQAEQDLVEIKAARKKAEETLSELQAAQKQLIQAEKMASLGELTAGIAHEIQNPLNFVNNFSEVSKELLDEMKEAIEKGDTEDAKGIMEDVIQNLEKITHHGKRADGIVKGMLQHSRSSSGQKEMTDINALCDEYLRLAYHGLRAKDKSFNAKFETHFHESIGKLNIVPQDMGRVILNLINNAFYAVSEKQALRQAQGDNYEPTVVVSTKKMSPAGEGEGVERVEISVRDNGNGIPASVKEKIFQPFFTTKPTGQGTGLGLSLSYDIIKAHDGEIKVETTEGEGTTFYLRLPINS